MPEEKTVVEERPETGAEPATVTLAEEPADPSDGSDKPAPPEDSGRWRSEAKKAFAARDETRKRLREVEEEKAGLESELASEKTRLEAELAAEHERAESLAAEQGRATELASAVESALEARMEKIRPDRRSLVPEDLPPEVRLAYIDRHEEILFLRTKSPPQGGAKPSGGEAGRSFRGMSASERAELRKTEPETYRRRADAEQVRLRRERQAEKSA